MTMLAATFVSPASLFARGTGLIEGIRFTSQGVTADNPLGPAMDVIVDLLTSPTAGFLVIAVFAARCLIAYAEGDEQKVRRQFVQLVLVAGVVILLVGFTSFLFSSGGTTVSFTNQ